MDFLTLPWIWFYAGVALMLAELATPGLVIFFFGLAAVSVAGLVVLFPQIFGAAAQTAAFSALSVLYLATLRRLVLRSAFFANEKPEEADEFRNRVATVVAPIDPARPGRVLLGDAEWEARADAPIAAGAAVRVVSRENLTLIVAPI